ncbi:Kinesin-like protein at 67A [Strongyloides ratti]|uniref:Kinesin-like protein n=1 Tax=Strongyloides ratti TaxID=34506 RepID=A0A090MQL7_STRRB|nr:Kinesin-like protein at 67A [Strongyloides ratti]CEF60468.1 Kinesin-like protein at 67A [Strongyloides ratti]
MSITDSNYGSQSNLNTDGVLTVVVRVRPINTNEKDSKQIQITYPIGNKDILLIDPEKFKNDILRINRQFEKQFTFDSVFGPESSNEEIHHSTTEHLINLVSQGNNATIFAYGATGAGKTYTMVGTKEKPGLMPLMTSSLYEKIKNTKFTEIYNELIKDLLNPSSPILDLLEDEKGNVNIPRLTKIRAINKDKLLQILQNGNQRRTKEATAANKESSRSHAILEVSVYNEKKLHGKLYLIDLAGSERASQTQNRGQRLKEGAAINKSLLALGNVINSLSSNSKGRYVNYRDSKLTRLLKDSLGGNCKTCMIANVTPCSSYYEETYNTLIYASRALNITTNYISKQGTMQEQINILANIEQAKKDFFEQRETLQNNISTFPNINNNIQLNNDNNLQQITNISTKNNKERQKKTQLPAWSTSTTSTSNYNDNRKFKTLFNSLKEQYLSLSTKQNKLRNDLLTVNQEAYELEINLISKNEILKEWSSTNSTEAKKFPKIISKFKQNIKELNKRSGELQDLRHKIEKSIRKNDLTMRGIEQRMRSVAKDKEQEDMINFMISMALKDAEKLAITSDSKLLLMRMKRQDFSLKRVYNYEKVTNKLLGEDLDQKDREQLLIEYTLLKNQIKYNLMSLKHNENVISWNTQLLNSTNHKQLPTLQKNVQQNQKISAKNLSLPKINEVDIDLPKLKTNSITSDLELSSNLSNDSDDKEVDSLSGTQILPRSSSSNPFTLPIIS